MSPPIDNDETTMKPKEARFRQMVWYYGVGEGWRGGKMR
jgi:hypothetical protein